MRISFKLKEDTINIFTDDEQNHLEISERDNGFRLNINGIPHFAIGKTIKPVEQYSDYSINLPLMTESCFRVKHNLGTHLAILLYNGFIRHNAPGEVRVKYLIDDDDPENAFKVLFVVDPGFSTDGTIRITVKNDNPEQQAY